MANSLRAKLSKLRHDGHITDAEYQEFLKKLDGHDREIRNRAIDEFTEKLCENVDSFTAEVNGFKADLLTLDYFHEFVLDIAQQMKGERE